MSQCGLTLIVVDSARTAACYVFIPGHGHRDPHCTHAHDTPFHLVGLGAQPHSAQMGRLGYVIFQTNGSMINLSDCEGSSAAVALRRSRMDRTDDPNGFPVSTSIMGSSLHAEAIAKHTESPTT